LKPRVSLRAPLAADEAAFLALARASRALHHPWVAAPDGPEKFRAWLQRVSQPVHAPFLVCRREDDAIVGVINLSNIVLGLFRSGYLSYYAFAGFEGQGYMREGLQAVIRHAFGTLKLHRLEANIQPGNLRSVALVRSCGFAQEGFSPRYLKIGGRWRDHERWALLAS
jgi:[ribosomal protein S5]-alanine N-acetyltransferase